METLKCRRVPWIRFPDKKMGSRERYDPMTDKEWREWCEWSGDPLEEILPASSKSTKALVSPEEIKPLVTPAMIYAKEIYKIPYSSFTEGKLIKKAQASLAISDRAALLSMDERKNNFIIFERERFNKADPWGSQLDGIFKKGIKAYKYLKSYSETDYGSLMVARVNDSKDEFTIYAITEGDEKYQAMGTKTWIRLPVNFPLLTRYPLSGQLIDPLAVIHHEFEHTRFGRSDYPIGSLREEVAAVRDYENPVRIINGFEPRYTYYQRDTETTVSVFDYKNTVSGGKTFDPLDPRKFK